MTHHALERVVIEATGLSDGRSGIGHYTAEIARHLAMSGVPTVAVLASSDTAGTDNSDLGAAGVEIIRADKRELWAYLAADRILGRAGVRAVLPRFEAFSGPGRAVIFPNYRRFPTAAPSATTIHDLAHVLYPAYVEPGFRGRLCRRVDDAVAHSTMLQTVSFSVAAEICDFYGVSAERVRVVSACPPDLPAVREGDAGVPGAILAVGELHARKNLVRLIAAHRLLGPAVRKLHPLVLVGRPSFGAQDVFAAIDGDRHIRHLCNIDGATLAGLYESAAVVTQTTLYEGFGLPQIEALRAGAVLVVSDIPVMHEVTDGAAVAYVDPLDVDAIAHGLSIGLASDRDALRPTAQQAAARYTWERSTRELVEVLDLIAP